MKGLLLVSAVLFSLTSQASFVQETCSSADGSTVFNFGHINDTVQVTKYVKGAHVPVYLNRNDIRSERKHIVDVKEEKFSSCDLNPGSGSGYASFDTYWTAELSLRNTDGSEFDQQIIGVSSDKKTVEAVVLCHRHINSLVICQK